MNFYTAHGKAQHLVRQPFPCHARGAAERKKKVK